jgi:hypothetical protein
VGVISAALCTITVYVGQGQRLIAGKKNFFFLDITQRQIQRHTEPSSVCAASLLPEGELLKRECGQCLVPELRTCDAMTHSTTSIQA